MMTMGSDFQYENADLWFKNLDKLIKYVQLNGTINVMYSTPSIYAKYVNEGGIKLTLKTDDFFPYADAPWNYWSGYFTSRPSLKGYVRKTNSDLQACKQLEAITPQFNMGSGPSSITLQNAMGVAQHHDAVSGTEKQHVADDYAKRLYIGGEECQVVMATYLSKLATKPGSSKMDLKFCESLNISMCTPSESGEVWS
jgi:lysosomal alpha-mannosidase